MRHGIANKKLNMLIKENKLYFINFQNVKINSIFIVFIIDAI